MIQKRAISIVDYACPKERQFCPRFRWRECIPNMDWKRGSWLLARELQSCELAWNNSLFSDLKFWKIAPWRSFFHEYPRSLVSCRLPRSRIYSRGGGATRRLQQHQLGDIYEGWISSLKLTVSTVNSHRIQWFRLFWCALNVPQADCVIVWCRKNISFLKKLSEKILFYDFRIIKNHLIFI